MNGTKWKNNSVHIGHNFASRMFQLVTHWGITTIRHRMSEIPAADQERFSMLFHDEYVDQFQLDVEKFSQREQALQRGYALVNSESPNPLSEGKIYSLVSATQSLLEDLHCSTLANSRTIKPDGFGVIYDNSMSYYTYIGNFSKVNSAVTEFSSQIS